MATTSAATSRRNSPALASRRSIRSAKGKKFMPMKHSGVHGHVSSKYRFRLLERSKQLRIEQTTASFFNTGPAVEGGQTEITFPGCAEAAARRCDDVGVLQDAVEQIPACCTFRATYPQVRGVGIAVDFQADRSQGIIKQT